jgi:hypothetical protein
VTRTLTDLIRCRYAAMMMNPRLRRRRGRRRRRPTAAQAACSRAARARDSARACKVSGWLYTTAIWLHTATTYLHIPAGSDKRPDIGLGSSVRLGRPGLAALLTPTSEDRDPEAVTGGHAAQALARMCVVSRQRYVPACVSSRSQHRLEAHRGLGGHGDDAAVAVTTRLSR